MQLDDELAGALRVVRARQDIVQFLGRWLSSGETEFRRLPADMLDILKGSPDFTSLEPGSGPVVLQLETEDANAALVVYRAAADAAYYVLAPAQPVRD